MRRIGIFLVVFLSVLCGVVASGLAYNYLKERADSEAPELVPVVVASHDMSFATTLGPLDMRVVMFPSNSVPEGAYDSPDSLLDHSTKVFLKENEAILDTKLSTKGGGLSLLISPEMRAVSVKVDKVSGVSGFIVAGDRVDVVATVKNNNKPETKTILQNIEVLAAGHKTETGGDKVIEAQSVTLLTTPAGAQDVALAMKEGKVDLVLRNPADTSVVPDVKSRTLAEMMQGEKKAAPKPVSKPKVTPKVELKVEEPKPVPPVTIFKGPQADTVRPAIQPNNTTKP